MDKNKSQTRIRLSSLLPTRIEEGLSFSDYFDDSIPYEVKPVPSVTPMQEDDFPVQSKDLFKGLWEEFHENYRDYWMDSDGKFLEVKSGHAQWAVNYLVTHKLMHGFQGDEDIIEEMYKLGFVWVKVLEKKIYIGYKVGEQLKNIQWRNLKNVAIEYGMKLIDSRGTYGSEVELQETVGLSGDKTGKTLFMDGMMPEDIDAFKSHLAQLFAYLKEELQLRTVPKVKLVEDEKNAAKILGKTAYYDAENKLVVLYITNRHQKDILRSFSHEVIHHWQHENEKLNANKGESSPEYAQKNPWLRQMEKQAYLLGNMLFRDWEDKKKAKDRKSGKKMVESDQSPIPPETPYGVIDAQTKKVVFKTTYINRNRARRFADKKDLEYGAHRYIPMILNAQYLKEKTMLIGKQYPPKKPNYRG